MVAVNLRIVIVKLKRKPNRKGILIMNNTLGQRISALRKEKGFTQEELAVSLGVSAQAVSKWENDVSHS